MSIPYQPHSSTSKVAARAITKYAESLEAQVLARIKFVGGATDEELYHYFQTLNHWTKESTVRARRVRLVELGLVRDSGAIGKTRSGRKATVWKAT